jgi:hypothetical protein
MEGLFIQGDIRNANGRIYPRNEIERAVKTIQEQLSSTRNQKIGQDIISSIQDAMTLEQKGQTVKQVEERINKAVPVAGAVDSSTKEAIEEFKKADPYDKEAFKKLVEALKNQFSFDKDDKQGQAKGEKAAVMLREASIAESNRKKEEEAKDPVKALRNQQSKLNAQLETAREKVKEFGEAIAPSGLKATIDSMMESARKASENIEEFAKFSKQIGSLNEAVNTRLAEIEDDVRDNTARLDKAGK